jgi:hypothetical protein
VEGKRESLVSKGCDEGCLRVSGGGVGGGWRRIDGVRLRMEGGTE